MKLKLRKCAFTLAEVLSPHPTSQQKYAFTLAEVLITLGIIGVVAALTLPSIIAHKKEKETAARLKKVYSTLSQAHTALSNKYGTPDEWGITSNNTISNKLKEELNVVKDCTYKSNCYKNNYKFLDKNPADAYSFANPIILNDGTAIGILVISNDCTGVRGTAKQLENSCAEVFIDINGSQKPNIFGEDAFAFYLTKLGFFPLGSEQSKNEWLSFETHCQKSKNVRYNGYGCTAWVMYNENMDYLHCDDLNWQNKTSCN